MQWVAFQSIFISVQAVLKLHNKWPEHIFIYSLFILAIFMYAHLILVRTIIDSP